MWRTEIASAARRIKGADNFDLDPETPPADIFEICVRRLVMATRGFWLRLWVGRVDGLLFVGRRVSIRHGRHLSFGRNVYLEDDVYIDALSRDGVEIGDHVTLGSHAMIRVSGTLSYLGRGVRIDHHTAIGAHSFIGAAGGVTIGSHVLMGNRISFHAENHNYEDAERLISEQGVRRQGIIVEDDCWLGSGCYILDGVTIGRGAVVAAGSVVTADVQSFTVVAGIPAKPIRRRSGIAES